MAIDELATRTAPAVPFVDLAPGNLAVKAQVLRALDGLIDTGAFSNGPYVAEFESAFAAACGAPRCVGVASGLDALRLSLLALGVGPGDEVIVPAQTFVATYEAVTQTGAVPVPVDVSPDDLCLDPEAAAAAVGPHTRALLPVHLYGQLADMRRLAALARRHDLLVVEDACQAHGAARDGVLAGSAGAAAAFSFYPAKNLGAFGDAGAMTTADDRVAERVAVLREHGQRSRYEHVEEGYTSRLDTVQALVLLQKLPLLPEWNAERRRAAEHYLAGLAGVGDLRLPPVPAGSEPVWHLFVVRTEEPETLARFLAERGVATGRHYPVAPPLTDAYARLGHRPGAFPVAEDLARRGLSLPIFPGIAPSQLDHVVAAVREYFAG